MPSWSAPTGANAAPIRSTASSARRMSAPSSARGPTSASPSTEARRRRRLRAARRHAGDPHAGPAAQRGAERGRERVHPRGDREGNRKAQSRRAGFRARDRLRVARPRHPSRQRATAADDTRASTPSRSSRGRDGPGGGQPRLRVRRHFARCQEADRLQAVRNGMHARDADGLLHGLVGRRVRRPIGPTAASATVRGLRTSLAERQSRPFWERPHRRGGRGASICLVRAEIADEILLLCHSFNSLTQRLHVELRERGHRVSVEFDVSDTNTREAVDLFEPDSSSPLPQTGDSAGRAGARALPRRASRCARRSRPFGARLGHPRRTAALGRHADRGDERVGRRSDMGVARIRLAGRHEIEPLSARSPARRLPASKRRSA